MRNRASLRVMGNKGQLGLRLWAQGSGIGEVGQLFRCGNTRRRARLGVGLREIPRAFSLSGVRWVMGPDGQSVLQRFHSVLVQELGSRAARNRHSSLTVADIYFDLAPFQSLRKELGVESVFDYEKALLQLLAGQGGFLEMEYIGDRHKLQRHLESGNPDPDLFRELLQAGVRVCSPLEEEQPDQSVEKDLPLFQDCPSCTESLPQRTGVSFCPFCGTDLRRTPCVSCDEKLKLDWRFCIACGTKVEQGRASSFTH